MTDNLSIGGRYSYQFHGDVDLTDNGDDPVSLDGSGQHSLELVGKMKF